MISCIDRYQQLIGDLGDATIAPDSLRKYIDLCNEEFFYFRHGYLPNEVVNEWLDGMISLMPQISENSKIAASDLEEYPRLRNAFVVDCAYVITNPDERRAFIKNISRRIGAYDWDG